MAMKTTKTNWRVEVQFADKRACNSFTRAVTGVGGIKLAYVVEQKDILALCALHKGEHFRVMESRVKVKHDEEDICDACGRLWKSRPVYHGEPKGTLFYCYYCNAPEEGE